MISRTDSDPHALRSVHTSPHTPPQSPRSRNSSIFELDRFDRVDSTQVKHCESVDPNVGIMYTSSFEEIQVRYSDVWLDRKLPPPNQSNERYKLPTLREALLETRLAKSFLHSRLLQGSDNTKDIGSDSESSDVHDSDNHRATEDKYANIDSTAKSADTRIENGGSTMQESQLSISAHSQQQPGPPTENTNQPIQPMLDHNNHIIKGNGNSGLRLSSLRTPRDRRQRDLSR